MYETMMVWQTPEVIPGLTPAMRDFARIWQAADKVVYLQIAGDRLDTEDASRAGIRTAGGARAEGAIAARYFGGGSEPGRTGDPGRTRRRV